MVVFFAIPTILYLFSIIELRKREVVNSLSIFFIFLLLLIFGGLKKIGIARDDLNYLDAFQSISNFKEYFLNFEEFSFYEPLFHFIVVINKFFFSTHYSWYFFVFVLLALLSKFHVILKYSNYFFPALMIYFSSYFLLHEMTQIRIGLAGGVVMIAWFLYAQGKKEICFWLLVLSTLAHYSAILAFSIYLLNTSKPTLYFYGLIVLMIFSGVVLDFDMKTILISLKIPGVSDKIAAYKYAEDTGIITHTSNIYNSLFFVRFFLLGLFIFLTRYAEQNSNYNLFLKLYALSIGFYLLLSADPSISIRISEVFGIASVFLLVMSIDFFKERLLVLTLLYIYCMGLLTVFLINDKLFFTYKFFLG